MSARDDYPQIAGLDRTNYVGVGAEQSVDVQARKALDEIDQLRDELGSLARLAMGTPSRDVEMYVHRLAYRHRSTPLGQALTRVDVIAAVSLRASCPTCGGSGDAPLRGFPGSWHTLGPDCVPGCLPCSDEFHHGVAR